MNKRKYVSSNVIRRLPRYLRTLNKLLENNMGRISSKSLGELMGFTPSQIRQDFSCFGEFGIQGYGYDVKGLIRNIEKILGMHRGYDAILIGYGNIGRALICNFDFSEHGIKMLCAFDTNKSINGAEINGIPIKHVSCLENFLKEHEPVIAVLAVPPGVAKDIAELLLENGVQAIWNFTGEDVVKRDRAVKVENVHFADSLLCLGYYISERKDERTQNIT